MQAGYLTIEDRILNALERAAPGARLTNAAIREALGLSSAAYSRDAAVRLRKLDAAWRAATGHRRSVVHLR
jgi:DNA-binding Lrp family transcriptional regulator